MDHVEIHTDGACFPNPGRGGWAAILLHIDSHGEVTAKKTLQGTEPNSTNNKMELVSVIKGLESLKRQCYVYVYSDSQYVVNAFNNGWINKWQNNGWTNSQGKAVKNQDLWDQLIGLVDQHNVTFKWIKGHAGNRYNEMADRIANQNAGIDPNNPPNFKRRNPRKSNSRVKSRGCEVCGNKPVIPETGMCGPCTHGTADAFGEGEW